MGSLFIYEGVKYVFMILYCGLFIYAFLCMWVLCVCFHACLNYLTTLACLASSM